MRASPDPGGNTLVYTFNHAPFARVPFDIPDLMESAFEQSQADEGDYEQYIEDNDLDDGSGYAYLDWMNDQWLPANGLQAICHTQPMGTPQKFTEKQRQWILG